MIDFLIEVGVDAKDYDNIVTRGHLKPVELEAKKIEDLIVEVQQELENNLTFEMASQSKQSDIKSNVAWFGALSILVMAIATYIQVTYLKNFFKYKKII
jgi:hypothetical protein